MKQWMRVGLVAWTSALVVSAALYSQGATFEAVSIKPNTSGDGRVSLGLRGRRYEGINAPLWMVLTSAFDLGFEVGRLVGVPDWTRTERFDIVGTLPESAGRLQLPQLLEAMLADRFHLAVHREMRDAPIYALVLARADGRLGPRLRKSAVDCQALAARGPAPAPEPARAPACQSQIDAAILGRGQRLSTLARMLTPFAERTVIDRTGLVGGFDFDLTLPEQNAGRRRPGETAAPGANDPSGGVFTLLQDELGLKLESARAPLEFVVIERVDRPTAD
jgi:uncharacterized protein (TIGR03435 family)